MSDLGAWAQECPSPTGEADDELLTWRGRLIAAGMLILAGGGRGVPLDYDELERWTRVGFENGSAARRGER